MSHHHSTWMVVLGFGLLSSLTPSARGGNLFGCSSGGCETTVNIPPQRVVLETSAPRVSVQDTCRPARGPLPPVVGMVYMPMAFPVGGFGIGLPGGPDVTREEDTSLRTAFEAQAHMLRYDKARASLDAEIAHKRSILSRMSVPMATAETSGSSDLNSKISALTEKIDKLNERLTNLEKLVIIHDNYLKEKIQKDKPQQNAPEIINLPKTQ